MTEKYFRALMLATHLPVSQITLLSSKMSAVSTWQKKIDHDEKCVLESHDMQ